MPSDTSKRTLLKGLAVSAYSIYGQHVARAAHTVKLGDWLHGVIVKAFWSLQ